MALQQLPVPRMVHSWGNQWMFAQAAALTVDAAGESLFSIGRARLQGGSGSKTISAAGGGAMYFPLATVTFANAGTTTVWGIQDTASGLEDGTFDVSGTLVGGTDTITGSRYLRVVMETGSKSISHGTEYALGMEMTARGGTDSIQGFVMTDEWEPNRQLSYPARSHDTGAGPTLGVGCWTIAIEFDDGTLGWIDGLPPYIGNLLNNNNLNFNSGSTPDEYALVGSFPYRCAIGAIGVRIENIVSGDDTELIFYTDPLGTPSGTVAGVPVAAQLGGANAVVYGHLAAQTLDPNTLIGIAVRPTTVNNITISYSNLQTGNAALKAFSDFQSVGLYSRSNQTGAFSLVDALHVPSMFALQTALDDGVNVSPSAYTTQIVSPYRVAGY